MKGRWRGRRQRAVTFEMRQVPAARSSANAHDVVREWGVESPTRWPADAGAGGFAATMGWLAVGSGEAGELVDGAGGEAVKINGFP